MKLQNWKIFRVSSLIVVIGATSAVANAQVICAECIARMSEQANQPLTPVATPVIAQVQDLTGSLVGATSGPITFTPLKYAPKSNWDPFSGEPLPGSNLTSTGFDPNFSTPYWNDKTGFTNDPTAPWNLYVPAEDGEAAYDVGMYSITGTLSASAAIYWAPFFN